MTKKVLQFSLLMMLLFCLILPAFSSPVDIKFVSYDCDLFAVRFQKPETWEIKLTANYIQLTDPDNEDRQLVFWESEPYQGSLEDFFSSHINGLKEEENIEVQNKKELRVAGSNAYYVRIITAKKDVGHIVFLRRMNHFQIPYIIVFKSPKGEYEKYEQVLDKAIETMRFYNPHPRR